MRNFRELLPASKWKLVISSIGVLALILFSSIVIYETTKKEVVIHKDGEELRVKTHQDTVKGLLEEVGIVASKHDALSQKLDTNIENNMEIDYISAKEVTLTIDGEESTYYTTESTVGDFLKKNGLSFSKHDDVSHKDSTLIEDNLNISVKTAFEVTVIDGNKEKKVMTTGDSVQEVLKDGNINYDKDSNDKIKPGLNKKVMKDSTISITRVDIENEKLTEKIAYGTVTKKDSSLLKGKEEVITNGQDGEVVKKYKVTYENGDEVKRELIEENITKESVDKVVAVGTKEPTVATLSTGSNNSSGKTITMTASAFTSSCSGCSGYTATGINLKANPNKKVIAVDPNVIPLGSRVWIEGYGEAIAGDTGGHIKGNRIDVHVASKSTARQWGVRNVKVKILD